MEVLELMSMKEADSSTGSKFREVHLFCRLCTQPEDGKMGLCGDQQSNVTIVSSRLVSCVLCEGLANSHWRLHLRDIR